MKRPGRAAGAGQYEAGWSTPFLAGRSRGMAIPESRESRAERTVGDLPALRREAVASAR
jgi:hypothetical protein